MTTDVAWLPEDFATSAAPKAPVRSPRFLWGAAVSMILHVALVLWLLMPVEAERELTTPAAELAYVEWFEPQVAPKPVPEPAKRPATPGEETRPQPSATIQPATSESTPVLAIEDPRGSAIDEHAAPAPQVLNPATGTDSPTAADPARSPASPDPGYVWDVLNHLRQFQDYPDRARRRGEQGTVLLRARVARDGEVLRVRLLQSSGSRALDEAALRLLERASPLPKPPPGEFAISELELPISYALRQP